MARGDWKPIETAPRDGTNVDLWMTGGYGDTASKGIDYRETDCIWLTDTAAPRWVKRGECREALEDESWRATHWMLPPEPPVA